MSEDKNKKDKDNPIRTVWNVFGTIGGVLSLSSMTQTWFDDLIKWKGFLIDVFETYRSIIDPIFEYLFGFFPFEMWYWLGDYFILGIIFIFSFWRTALPYFTKNDIYKMAAVNFPFTNLTNRLGTIFYMWSIVFFIFLIVTLTIIFTVIWPIMLAPMFLGILRHKYGKKIVKREIERETNLLSMMFAIILFSVMLLSLNAVI